MGVALSIEETSSHPIWVLTLTLEHFNKRMLLILIPALWIAIAAFCVILCRSAAAGDRVMLAGDGERFKRTTSIGTLTVFEDSPARSPRDARLSGSGGRALPARRSASRVRGVRGRGGRCVAGS